MMATKFLTFMGMSTLVLAAAVHPARQAPSALSTPAQQECMATVYSYITVTVTNQPDRVTVAVPDYSSISRSLASASTIDSLVIQENSINRPVDAPPNTVVPTFIKTVLAPAVELTEIPHTGSSAVYLPGTKPITTVAIETFTESIIIPPVGGAPAVTTANAQSPERLISSLRKEYTIPPYGWNNTDSNITDTLPLTGTGATADQDSTTTLTEVTFVTTTTELTDLTLTPTPSYDSVPQWSGYGYGSKVKRQTCVLISAEIGGHWASWCNNWDGSSTYTFTSWETTVTPGTAKAVSGNDEPDATVSTTSTHSSTATVTGPGPSAAAPSMPPPSCGEIGPLNIGFDDLPKQSVSDNANAGFPPIFNPYRHFYWADGWSYVPPPNDPYPPHNGAQLAVYVPPPQSNEAPGPNAVQIYPGGFGAGPRSFISAYWFDARMAWVGCDNNATDPSGKCEFVAEGRVWDDQAKDQKLVVSKRYLLDLCHNPSCQLQQIVFTEQFKQLSSINFYAKIGGSVRTFYMDDLDLTWSNNTCDAGLTRASNRK